MRRPFAMTSAALPSHRTNRWHQQLLINGRDDANWSAKSSISSPTMAKYQASKMKQSLTAAYIERQVAVAVDVRNLDGG